MFAIEKNIPIPDVSIGRPIKEAESIIPSFFNVLEKMDVGGAYVAQSKDESAIVSIVTRFVQQANSCVSFVIEQCQIGTSVWRVS